jgi:hypothetical protein
VLSNGEREYDSTKIRTSKLPIALNFKLESHREGTATILESILEIT